MCYKTWAAGSQADMPMKPAGKTLMSAASCVGMFLSTLCTASSHVQHVPCDSKLVFVPVHNAL